MIGNGLRLDMSDLLRLRSEAASLGLAPWRRVRAAQAGAHRSPFRGRGMEFDEVRPYQPGDDVRNIDWRVTARTGTTHTKLFREERERPVLLLVDQGPNMHFATRVAFKSVIAAYAAGLVAWAAADHGDRVGAVIFEGTGHKEVRPQRGPRAALGVCRALAERTQREHGDSATAASSWSDALSRAARIAHPGTLLIVLSDFAGPPGEAARHLLHLTRHCEVLMVFIYDPVERVLPAKGMYTVSDGANRLVLDMADRHVRALHQAAFDTRYRLAQDMARRARAGWGEIATTDAVGATLRAALTRSRGVQRAVTGNPYG